MTIDEVSKKFDISKHTLRYYENIGLIDDVIRNESRTRNYSPKDINRIQFIIAMRKAGVGINNLKEYIDLVCAGDTTIEKRKEILLNQQAIIKEKIVDLEKSLSYLNYKIENYDLILKDKEI